MTTLNGQPLLALHLVIPRVGAWTADVEVDSDAGPADGAAATLDLEGRVWRGTVVRGAAPYGRWSGRIVGGAGGLARELPPVALANTTLRAVLEEALRAAGETIAPTADTLTAAVARWHRTRAPGSTAIAEVARAAGLPWRVLADGAVWVGAETWAALIVADVDVMGREPVVGCTELAGEAALDIAPGRTVTLDGVAVRVGGVTHRLDGVALRTSVLEEREDVAGGRLMAAFEAVVRRITRRLDFSGSYAATVVQQRADGTLDLRPEDPRRPSCSAVPYRTLPGLTVEIPAGSRVCFTYEDADPRRPVVVLWEPTTSAGRWTLYSGTRRAARIDDTTANGSVTATVAPTVPPPPLPAPPTNDVTLTYTAPGGATSTITLTGLPASVAASGSHALVGKITSGTDLLRLP